MGKALLLIRVSSERQDYEAQTDELIQFVKSFGYTDDDLILIQDKESAIKLSEEERQGLNRMKEAINENPNNIDAAFIWELSRLSRQPKILYSIRDFLLERKINLIVKEPFLKLLDDNKNPISTSLIQFGFFIALVENEMRDKKARFERGKRNRATQGKYTGGYIRFGYTIDPDTKKYVINDDEADIIKLIYNLYETEKYSHKTIVTELKELGYGNDIANIGKVQNILNADEYTGIAPKSKLKINFPPIITTEQFNRCREISDGNNSKLNKSNTTVYYSQLLLWCTCCQTNLHPRKSANLYGCADRSALSDFTKDTVIERCKEQNYISMSIIDSFLWHLAKEKEGMTIINSNKEQIDDNNIKINELQNKLENIQIRFDDIKKKRNRLGLSFSDDMIDEENYNKRKEKLNEEEALINQDKLFFKNEIDRYNSINENITNSLSKLTALSTQDKFKQNISNLHTLIQSHLNKITDDKTRYDIIRKHIERVFVSKTDEKDKLLIVHYHNYNEFPDEIYIYNKESKQTKPVIYRFSNKLMFDVKVRGDVRVNFPIVREFKIKPKLGEYDKVKKRMEEDPEYAIKKKKEMAYYRKCYKIKVNPNLSKEEKEDKINSLTIEYRKAP